MASLNEVRILGNLGKDVDLKHTTNGKAVANFSVATTNSWTDKQTSQKVEQTEWHRVVVWDKLAELCAKYLAKGRQCMVLGSLKTRSYEKDGVTKYQTEIVADDVIFLGGKGSVGQVEESPSARPPQSVTEMLNAPPAQDDDVPF
jgi:single-strand DNA-binding protein